MLELKIEDMETKNGIKTLLNKLHIIFLQNKN